MHLTYLLGHTMSLIRQKLMEKFRENKLDISIENYVMLLYINNHENLTQQHVADHFLKDKSIVQRHVNALMMQKYIVRATDSTDKRKKNLMLTERGKEMIRLTAGISEELSSELLNGVTGAELFQFNEVIRKIQLNTGYTKCLASFNN